jgi:long-subunit acyl-CoA synthetase (AMP-forming)
VVNTVVKVVKLAEATAKPDVNNSRDAILLNAGVVDEICAHGLQIAIGYLGNNTATRELFDKDSYLYTGDVGYIDKEGLIVISDRIKEIIKVRGQ